MAGRGNRDLDVAVFSREGRADRDSENVGLVGRFRVGYGDLDATGPVGEVVQFDDGLGECEFVGVVDVRVSDDEP